MDYYHQEESTYLKQPYSFSMSDCKCSSEKMTKKSESSSCKEPLESFEYSSLFSTRTYSILSYIVGGFIGSKSQMNNKHNLSYDLSAAIFNLLNPCKYEKEKISVRKSSENNFYSTPSKINPGCYEKYIVNKSSQKYEKMKDSLVEVTDLEWLRTTPNQEFVGHDNYNMEFNKHCCSSNFSHIMKEDHDSKNYKNKDCDNREDKEMPCNSTENLKTAIYAVAQASQIDCKILTEKSGDQTGSCEIANQLAFDIKTSEDMVDNSIIQISSLVCDDFEDSNRVEMTVSNPQCQSSIKVHSVNFLATQRFRQQSECSVESTDSESFIVFDEFIDQEENDYKKNEECLNISKDDFDSDDDDNDDCDDEDSNCNEYDIYSVDTEIAEANNKWLRNYQDISPHDETQTKVKFNDCVKVNKIVAWDYAYRAARPGPWEQMARDRVRFRERIFRLSSSLSPVLRKEHREKIYKKLYS